MTENPIPDDALQTAIHTAEDLLRQLRTIKKSQKIFIDGWRIVRGNGYFRAIRRFGEKTHAVHIGRDFCMEDAVKKIGNYLEKNKLFIPMEGFNDAIISQETNESE